MRGSPISFKKTSRKRHERGGAVQKFFCNNILLDIIDRQKENFICGFILKEKASRIRHGGVEGKFPPKISVT